MPAEVQVFRLGGVWLVILPGEVFVEIGWRVRDAVAGAAGVPARQVVVAAYANGNVGYVPTGAAMPEGGYEVHAYRTAAAPPATPPKPRRCWLARRRTSPPDWHTEPGRQTDPPRRGGRGQRRQGEHRR